MPRANLPTFAGGEIGDELLARDDTAKFKTSLRRARNMIIRPAGGVFGRPGLLFAGEVHDSARRTRSITFQFSVNQGYMMEFGHYTLRFASQGGFILRKELKVLSITNALNAIVLVDGPHGYEVGWDVVFTGIEGMTEINGLRARILFKDAVSFTTDIDTQTFGIFTGSGGGIAGDANGGVGGDPAPPPPPAPTDPPPAPPPFVDYEPPPFTYGYFNPGDIHIAAP